jgi:hypothetical protein
MKPLEAFQVKATIANESWSTRGTVLTANSETEAAEKAKQVLNLKAEHVLEIEKVRVFESNAKLETNDYPYGRLRATAFFSVEYNKKGARTVFQTICPKSGRLNKPKNSTYYRAILPMQLSNGHFDYCGYLDFNGTEEMNRGVQFMADFYELFTADEIKNIALDMLSMSKLNAKAMCIYAGSNWEDLKPLIDTSVRILTDIVGSGENLFQSCLLDVKAIEATKKPDYQPFRVVQYGE